MTLMMLWQWPTISGSPTDVHPPKDRSRVRLPKAQTGTGNGSILLIGNEEASSHHTAVSLVKRDSRTRSGRSREKNRIEPKTRRLRPVICLQWYKECDSVDPEHLATSSPSGVTTKILGSLR
nr:hypothetical protein CFP56_38918 [Quercus suber]